MAFHRTTRDRSKPMRGLGREVSEYRKPYARKPHKKTYCICNGPSEGLMIECESCNEWFHAACIGVTEDKIPKIFHCIDCVAESNETKALEDTIVEALSCLAEQAALEGKLAHNKQDVSDRDEESMEEGMPPLNSDDKENTPNGSFKEEPFFPVYKKKSFNQADAASYFPSPFSPTNRDGYPSSPLSDASGSEDSSASIPSSPIDHSSNHSHPKRTQAHPVTKTYTRKNKKQISILEKYYEENQTPDANLIHIIAKDSGLPDQKVSRWFYDKRRRSKQLGLTHH